MTNFKLLAGAVLAVGSLGCVTDDDLGTETQALTGTLEASPRVIEMGTFRVDTTGTATTDLINTGRTDAVITGVNLLPPDPCTDPESCLPPDPCRIELLLPCIRPGDSSRLTVSCTSSTPGAIQLQADVAYSDGSERYHLLVPITGIVE